MNIKLCMKSSVHWWFYQRGSVFWKYSSQSHSICACTLEFQLCSIQCYRPWLDEYGDVWEAILAVKTGLLAFKRLYFASLGSKFYYPSAYISLFLINFWGSAPSSVEKSKICCILYDAPYFLIFDKLLKLCPFIYWFGDLVRSLWCLQFQLFSNQYREFEMHSTTCLLNQQNIISFEAVVIHSHSLNLLEKHPAFHWTPFLVGRLTLCVKMGLGCLSASDFTTLLIFLCLLPQLINKVAAWSGYFT